MEPYSDDSSRSTGKDLIGCILNDRYELIARIKRGGMGTVYLARHVAIGKRVAIKILSPQYATQRDAVRRLLQEARATSELRHPHIVDVSDFGHTAAGQTYLVMEYLEGEDLAETMHRDGPMPWIRVAQIILQVCSALESAHRSGIIHRDIKPSNCFRIYHAGDPDFIKLLDFGVAKVLGAAQNDECPVTDTGAILGTLDYMAPELFSSGQIDPRVDVYAVGMLAYKLLTDMLPFSGSTHEKVYKIVQRELLPPSVRAPHIQVLPGVEAILMRALHGDPTQRFQTIADLAEALLTQLNVPSPDAATMLKSGAFAALSMARFIASTRENEEDSTNFHRSHRAAPLTAIVSPPSSAPARPPRPWRSILWVGASTVPVALALVLCNVRLHERARATEPAQMQLVEPTGAQVPELPFTRIPPPEALAAPMDQASLDVAAAPPVEGPTLAIRSTPPEALVTIDGRSAGTAGPTRHPLAAGVHIVSCRRPGHRTRTLRVEVTADTSVHCRLPSESPPRAIVPEAPLQPSTSPLLHPARNAAGSTPGPLLRPTARGAPSRSDELLRPQEIRP